MASAPTWLTLLALLLGAGTGGPSGASAVTFSDKGFLLTCPKQFIAGTTERCCVMFYNMRGSVSLHVHVLPDKNSTTAQSVARFSDKIQVSSDYTTRCFKMAVPKKAQSGTRYLKASVKGRNFRSTKVSMIQMRRYTLITLVQTDKYKYKASQTVLFRVLTLKHDLTAQEEIVKQIFITTPSGTRLAQWKDVQTESGIIERRFQLTKEPPLGPWTIHVQRGDEITRQTFEVDEFVLPRFEVSITGQKFIPDGDRTVSLKVCAKYTFGKPVTSAAVALLARRSGGYIYRRYRNDDSKKEIPNNITLTDTTDSEGCASFDFLLSKIGIGSRFNTYSRQVIIKANVTEAGTDLVQSTDLTLRIQSRQQATIKIDKRPGTNFLKPGLKSTGYATAKRPDGSPFDDQILAVCISHQYQDQGAIKPIRNASYDYIFPGKAIGYRPTTADGERLVKSYFTKLPIIHLPITSKSSRNCREYKTNKDGRISFQIPEMPPGVISGSISVRRKSGSGSDSKALKGWFSLLDRYIRIMPITFPLGLKCAGTFKFKVQSNKEVTQKITYLVMTRGQIHTSGQININQPVAISLGFKVSPSFKVLVFYVDSVGETIADFQNFEVENCFQNQVKVKWDKKEVKPGQSASFTVTGAKNSVCGVTAVDRSVELLSDQNKLTAERVFQKLQQFVIGTNQWPRQVTSTNEYCKQKPRFAKRSGFFGINVAYQPGRVVSGPEEVMLKSPAPAKGIILPPRPPNNYYYYYRTLFQDSVSAFDDAGSVVLSNSVLESRPCEKNNGSRYYYDRPYYRGQGGGIELAAAPTFMRKTATTATSAAGLAVRETAVADAAVEEASVEEEAEAALRADFAETCLFDLKGLGSSGSATITKKMPDTITSWVGYAFCSGLQSGFGLSKSATITTFKPFFAQIQTPYSVKRGELLRLKVSVFNFHSSSLSVVVKLAPSDDYSLDSGSSSRSICVSNTKASVVDFPLQFSSLGKVDITVSAKTGGSACGSSNSIEDSDALRRSLEVKPEGFPQEEVNTAFVCKVKESAPPKMEKFALAKPNHLVPDSQRAWVNVVGDLLAPSAANLERLVRVPTGCGEQNLIGFFPNVLVRFYLEEVGLLTDNLKRRTTANMITGYQRQLRYRRRSGSYSAFPERSPKRYNGSLWLSLCTVYCYASASRYIPIDMKDVSTTTNWIVRKQKSNGAFERYGNLFHKEMRGGVGNGGEEALTAYGVIVLLKTGDQPKAVSKAIQFLKASSSYNTLYAEILVARALVAAGDADGAVRMQKLLKKGTRKGGMLYWKGDRSGPVGGSRAVDVEMTAYAASALIQLGGSTNLGEAALAMKWINTQRNSQGGFVSTQDTVVALMALTEFAKATYSKDTDVLVSVSAKQNFAWSASVSHKNRLLTRQKWLPTPLELPNQVTFKLTGKGCSVVQSVYRYNTKVAFPDPKFNLKAVIKKVKSSCSFTLNVCTSFKEPNARSNMAIVEIEMLSGFFTIDSSLRKLEKDEVIERWENQEGKTNLYFDKFTDKEVCFDVRFIRDIEVENLKPAIVRVYDYYANEDRFEVEYGPPDCP